MPTTVYATLDDPLGRPVGRRTVTATLISASRPVHDGHGLSVTARTVTDEQGRYSFALLPNGSIEPPGSYYLVREWEVGERAIVVPPTTDPRVDAQGRVSLLALVVDESTLLPEPAHRPPVYPLRAEIGMPYGVAGLDAGGRVPVAQIPTSVAELVQQVADLTARVTALENQ